MPTNPLTRPLGLADELTLGASLLADAAILVSQAGIAASDPDGARWIGAAARAVRTAVRGLMDVPPPREAARLVGRARGEVMAVEEDVLSARGLRDGDALLESLELLRILRFACERVIVEILGGRAGATSAPDVSATAAATLAEQLLSPRAVPSAE